MADQQIPQEEAQQQQPFQVPPDKLFAEIGQLTVSNRVLSEGIQVMQQQLVTEQTINEKLSAENSKLQQELVELRKRVRTKAVAKTRGKKRN